MIRPLLLALTALGTLAGPAAAADVTVAIPGKYFSPAQAQVVVGDTVTWANSDSNTHNLVGDGGVFDSGFLVPGGSFSRSFAAVGAYHYVCTIHPSMTGEVDVLPFLLAGPASQPTAGESFALTGRAPAGGGPLTLERADTADGAFAAAGTVSPAPDGSFSVPLTADTTAAWRVTDGTQASAPVTVPVLPRLEIRLSARDSGPFTVLSVQTLPARPGATVRLEIYSRYHFAWLRAGTAKLDGSGAITFSLRRGLRRLARVAYTVDGAAVHSRAIRVWRAG